MSEATDQLPAQQTRSSRLIVLICFVGLLGAAVVAMAVWQKSHNYHLAMVDEGVLYRDGMKSAGQFKTTLDVVHPRTVVSLIDSAELADPKKPQLAKEVELCASHNARLDRIPVKLGGWPTSEDIRSFLKIVSDKQNHPVLVHCAQGVRRTGFFVAAYQESVLGYDKAKAESQILTFGHSDNTVENIKRFIESYDPKSQTVSGDLGRGSE
jgi:protein tyrosine phosphatase (PTP) superfamily phosphohydrolase (DUF442 family)